MSCDDLKQLMDARQGRTAVAVILDGTRIQFVTFGREAADKLEAHNLKEWIKREVMEGNPTAMSETHESFILDAAKNKELKDELLAAIQRLRKAIHDEVGTNTDDPEIELDHAVIEADRVIAKAKAGAE